jgi:hypothetical protein
VLLLRVLEFVLVQVLVGRGRLLPLRVLDVPPLKKQVNRFCLPEELTILFQLGLPVGLMPWWEMVVPVYKTGYRQ